MTSPISELHTDVCVVGAGMLGLAHAHEARRRGLDVVLVDRDAAAVGASVRNFGHLFFGSQPDGPVFELGLRSRERWLELSARAGITPVQEGTLIIARHEDELAVLETALQNPDRGARLLTPTEAGRLAPLAPDAMLGALHSTLDLRVSPRTTARALARLLEDDPGATVLWNTQMHDVEPGRVHLAPASPGGTHARIVAPLAIVCPGPDYRSLPPQLRPGLEVLTRCRLQMLRTQAPGHRRYGPALATGLSLIRYPAFANQAPTAALRTRLGAERPELVDRGIHLLITQLPESGDLIIGDSHAYGSTLEPFADEMIDALLLHEAARLLGVDQLQVKERWLGIYATRADRTGPYEPFHITEPIPQVRVVENVAGIGMTLSLGFAAETFGRDHSSLAAAP